MVTSPFSIPCKRHCCYLVGESHAPIGMHQTSLGKTIVNPQTGSFNQFIWERWGVGIGKLYETELDLENKMGHSPPKAKGIE